MNVNSRKIRLPHFCKVSNFFFSSRRRHTRLQGDWSSDVCSSDLEAVGLAEVPPARVGAIASCESGGAERSPDVAVASVAGAEADASDSGIADASAAADRKSVV